MFTILHNRRVRTGQAGYAYLFTTESGTSYLFNRPLFSGSQSHVQLVTNTLTHELTVQKVSKLRPVLQTADNLTKVPEDNEIRIVHLLNDLAQHPVNPLPKLTPRWTTLISHENAAVTKQGPSSLPLRTEHVRVSYWKLCNGGDLATLASDWAGGLIPGIAPGHLFPVCVVALCIAQVCETLHFMYHAGAETIYHGDLHATNIFLHFTSNNTSTHNHGLPDFYLGDFGWATTASEDQAYSATWHKEYQYKYICTSDLPYPMDGFVKPQPAPGTQDPDERRRWDVGRFLEALNLTWIDPNNPHQPRPKTQPTPTTQPPTPQATALQTLLKTFSTLNTHEITLATHSPTSRPPSLLPLINQAHQLAHDAFTIEQHNPSLQAFLAWGRARAAQALGVRPFVFGAGEGAEEKEIRVARAEVYGDACVAGPWRVVEAVE
ncbi:uncharacterized protein C8A04DRAFT_13381 [Dichotomopilus funicola]|uniref:Protein kinase domain-containing protein n=1 Tax=Dichotomopilus funicola TaxID=1934379 RepID=A0AAN6V080_9PEZI|nr:hypothetical protein C8A04DRAFT_13381 [Dichotomopilus funicola]